VAANANTGANAEFFYMRPHEYDPPVYMPATLGASCFFVKAEIFVNGVKVEGPVFGYGGFLFMHLNRLLAPERIKIEKYGDPHLATPSVTSQRAIGDKGAAGREGDNIPEPMKRYMDTLQFDAKNTSRSQVGQFSFDGIPLLSAQSNITRIMSGIKMENPWVPPNTTVLIRLHKRDPIDALMEIPQLEDDVYWARANATIVRAVTKWEFSDLAIAYDLRVLEKKQTPEEIKKNFHFHDVPKIQLQSIAVGQMQTKNKVAIPAGCKVLLVAFAYQHQMFFNKGSQKNLSCRLKFAPGSIRLKFWLKDHPIPLLFREGLVNLGTDDAATSPSCHSYWQFLTQRGHYSRSKHHMFPSVLTDSSYEQFALVYLNHLLLDQPTEMTVEVDYNDTGSQEKWYLWSATIQQYKYSFRPGQALEAEPVI
jgi:hypothetical protein